MNTMHGFPDEVTAPTVSTPPGTREVLVWDAPVRVVHWLLVASFLGAFVTAESERWRLLHVSLGYAVGGLVAFRVIWGLVGTRHARFSSFVRGPSALMRYLRSLAAGRPERHAGHNPAGAVAILALLGLAAALAVTGHALYIDFGGNAMEDWHEALANAMLAIVALHVAAVVVMSLLHRENLVKSMLTGRKRVDPSEAISSPWRALAALVFASVLLCTGWLAWTAPSAPGSLHATFEKPSGGRESDEDHD